MEFKKGDHIRTTAEYSNTRPPTPAIKGVVEGTYDERTIEVTGLFNGEKKAEPIPKTETRVVGPIKMMQGLLDRGYRPNDVGDFEHYRTGSLWTTVIWQYCGKALTTPSHTRPQWKPWMLEEVEI